MTSSRARFVRVAVNDGRPTFMTFSYRVPPGREAAPGEVVHAPFGRRTLQGVVVEGPFDLPGYPDEKTRDLDPPVEGAPRLGPVALALASWIAGYYRAPPWESHALLLPPGALLVLLALMAIEADYTWLTRVVYFGEDPSPPREPQPGGAH